MEEIILKMSNITKSFPGVKALKGVSMELRQGEIHALLGENGAGKSTLIKCLAGIYPTDSGTVEFEGRQVEIRTPADSMKLGISVIHQELVLAEQLTVADNIFMGSEPANRLGFIDKNKILLRASVFQIPDNNIFVKFTHLFPYSYSKQFNL